MKFKNLLLSLIIFLSFASVVYSQAYYPLEIGNSWKYRYHEWSFPPYSYSHLDTFIIEVEKDTILPNGNKFFQLNQDDLTTGISSKLVRADSNFIYYYADSTEIPFYKLNATIGEEWTVHQDIVELISIDTIIIFNVETRVMRYQVDGLIIREITFSDKFGPISYYSPGEPPGISYTNIDLIGCKISTLAFGDTVTNIERTNSPQTFYLSQNYPNPFNSNTVIEYNLPEMTIFEITLYNSLGQMVKEIFSGVQSAGIHRIEIDASSLSSGVYFYKFSSRKFDQVNKCLLLK